MPSGRTHDLITAGTAPMVGLGSYLMVGDFKIVILLTSLYLFSSLMFNGDLDIMSRPYRRWLMLRWIWYPYRKIFEHRSVWTHGIIIGTLVRVIYFTLMISIIITGVYIILDIILSDLKMIKLGFKMGRVFNISIVETYREINNFGLSDINWNMVLIIFFGLELGNTVHTLSDKLITGIRYL